MHGYEVQSKISHSILWYLVGRIQEWLPHSTMANSILNITSIASIQNRTKYAPTVIIHTVGQLSVVMHRSSWQCLR